MAKHEISLSPEQADASYRQLLEGLRHDGPRGFTVWLHTTDPVMFVWSPRIYEFLQVLEETISYLPARGVCREVGYRSGADGARAIRETLAATKPNPPEVLLQMPGVLAGAGWGVSELSYDDADQSILWRFPRGTAVGVAAGGRGHRVAPACAFFEGFGAGWVKESLGSEVEFLEMECVGQGQSRCAFQSQPLG